MQRVVAVRGVKFLLPRWGMLGREARLASTAHPPDKRRGQRVSAALPVFVYGRMGDEPFQEETETINVSAQGGLVAISAQVVLSQKLILTNLQTNEDLVSRVARLVTTGDGRTLAGLEFLQPSPRFWGISFGPGAGDPAARGRF